MYRNKVIAIVFFTIITSCIEGQVNNVLNYSFEQNSGCSGIGNCSWTNVNYWRCPSATYIDWYSFPCFGASAQQGIPQNFMGYQFARTGQSYAGIVTDTLNAAGYITGTLSDSLNATQKYCVVFYVSLADSEWWAISRIGAYLSNDSICMGNTYAVLNDIPQVENPAINFLTDKVHWVPISGEFQAKGGEKFITIGDFHKTILSDFDSVGHGGFVRGENSEVQTYYYIDDVYVRELTIAVAGKADTVCLGDSVLIGKDALTPGVSFHWLPTIGLSNPNIPQPKASPTTTTTYTLTVVNDSIHNCNCADSVTKDMVTISVCTGINEIKENNNIRVSPNPSNGFFSISGLEKNMRIELYDYTGRLVNSYVATASTQITISDKPDGVYLIRILTNEGTFVGQRKLIKLGN